MRQIFPISDPELNQSKLKITKFHKEETPVLLSIANTAAIVIAYSKYFLSLA